MVFTIFVLADNKQWGCKTTNDNGDLVDYFPIAFSQRPCMSVLSIVTSGETHICDMLTPTYYIMHSFAAPHQKYGHLQFTYIAVGYTS